MPASRQSVSLHHDSSSVPGTSSILGATPAFTVSRRKLHRNHNFRNGHDVTFIGKNRSLGINYKSQWKKLVHSYKQASFFALEWYSHVLEFSTGLDDFDDCDDLESVQDLQEKITNNSLSNNKLLKNASCNSTMKRSCSEGNIKGVALECNTKSVISALIFLIFKRSPYLIVLYQLKPLICV